MEGGVQTEVGGVSRSRGECGETPKVRRWRSVQEEEVQRDVLANLHFLSQSALTSCLSSANDPIPASPVPTPKRLKRPFCASPSLWMIERTSERAGR